MEVFKRVEKPWDREIWIAVTDKYALKIIEIRKGTRASLQCHAKKHEHIYVDSGTLQMEWESEDRKMVTLMLKAGELIEVKPGCKHRASAPEDVRLIEVSTPEMDDVVRIQDDFKRK